MKPVFVHATMAAGLVLAACGGGEVSAVTEFETPASAPAEGVAAAAYNEGDSKPHGSLDSVTLFEIALRHMREGHPDSALEHLDLAQELDPANPRLLDARSSALLALDRTADALAASEAAVSLLPKDPGLRVNRANIYRRFGRDQEAFQDYARALELVPGYAPAAFNRGTLRFHQGDNQAALADYDLAIASQPDSGNFYFNRAMVHEALGDLTAAEADMTFFLEHSENRDFQDLAQTLLATWSADLPTVQEPDRSRTAFDQLVSRCGLEFQVPQGFRFAPGREASGLDYEGTLFDDSGELEVRIALRCLADAEIDYQDPHSSTPSPEHIYPLLYQAIVEAIATDPESPNQGFGEAALAEYGADWGQAVLLNPDPRFSADHSSLLLIALHRRSAADVYLVFLFDDYQAVQDKIRLATACLQFVDTTDSEAPAAETKTELPAEEQP